ncbi:MAG: hypothetical protein COB09_19120 [Thalassobium sp.]|nr:MAG: hypothetical protein COB09_19120 [Thalassobium sp.]
MTNTDSTIANPDLTTLLDAVKREVAVSLNCVKIGTIESFDSATQLASIQISIDQVESVDTNGVKQIRQYPLLLECPVVTIFGGDSFINMPITVGDSCLVFFSDRQIDNWLSAGAGQAPTIGRVHDLSDGIALVGIRPKTNSIPNFLGNGIRIFMDENNSIDLTSAGVTVNATTVIINSDTRVEGKLEAQDVHADNGATGTFDVVTVVDGIVISGT